MSFIKSLFGLNQGGQFSTLRGVIWPIYREELKKFFPMSIIIFCILLNYTILRNMKDTLVMKVAGAGTLAFLKLYVVTPVALIFVVLFTKAFNKFGKEKTFYVMITPFLVFYLLFAFIIYPNQEMFHPNPESIANAIASYPRLTGFINIYAYWSFSLFFVLAEIWGSMGLAVLFWQFANRVTKLNESKRFYPLFIAIGNLSLILCGIISSVIKSQNLSWSYSIKVQMIIIAISGIVAMYIYRFLHTGVLTDPKNLPETSADAKKKEKVKMGLVESMKLVFSSKELLLIAALVMCYGISINLVEVQWKNQVKLYFNNDSALINNFFNTYSLFTGISAIVFGWVVGVGALKKLSWFTCASFTPIVLIIGGSMFFCAMFAKSLFESIAMNPLLIGTYCGMVIVMVTKLVKYAMFDTTKEMAYLVLDDDVKNRGKAAVEVIGGRFGKAGGAFLQTTALMIVGTTDVTMITKYSAFFFIVAMILWILSASKLNGRLLKIRKEN